MRCVDLYNQTQSKWFEEMVTTSMVTVEPSVHPDVLLCFLKTKQNTHSLTTDVSSSTFRSWRSWRWNASSGFSSIYASTRLCGTKQTCSTRVWVYSCVCAVSVLTEVVWSIPTPFTSFQFITNQWTVIRRAADWTGLDVICMLSPSLSVHAVTDKARGVGRCHRSTPHDSSSYWGGVEKTP